ncbi:MAG TPA: AmmeMemoRadiSam system protein B, partial [Thermoanaerobaculia bacterium]
MIRPAAFAGAFYEASPGSLRRHIQELLAAPWKVTVTETLGAGADPGAAVGAIVPHAGYIY